jgi:hypothetical protein
MVINRRTIGSFRASMASSRGGDHLEFLGEEVQLA